VPATATTAFSLAAAAIGALLSARLALAMLPEAQATVWPLRPCLCARVADALRSAALLPRPPAVQWFYVFPPDTAALSKRRLWLAYRPTPDPHM
jgi:hypothetical protein